jgi:hypothetical protein
MRPTLVPILQQRRRDYFLGLGLGFAPLLLFLIMFVARLAWGPGSVVSRSELLAPLLMALFPYLAIPIATVICLSMKSLRWAGYGLLMASLVSPGVIAIIWINIRS